MSHYSSVPLAELTPKERQEMIERSAKRRQEGEESEGRRPLNPDKDLSWENQSFGGSDYD